MKKLLALIMTLTMLLGFAACEPATEESVKVMAPDGAPGIVVAKMVSEGKIYGKTLDVEIVAGAEQISANVASGAADIAVMPINLASKLYNGGVKIKLVSVNVFGSLYMVGKQDLSSLSELKGKIVYNIGKGGTPDLTLKYILKNNGIEFVESETAVDGKVALQYVSAASELIPLLKTDRADFGIMGEPAVTNCNNAAGTKTVVDIQAEWKKITGEDYTQAGLVVSEKLAENKYFMSALCKVLEANAEWCNANAASIKSLLNGVGSSLKLEYTPELLARCNVGYGSLSLVENKNEVESYLSVLMGFNPKVIGDKLPDDGFYYGYTEIKA